MNFLVKFGGSLITFKNEVQSPRRDVIRMLAADLVRARKADPDLRLVLGHGSGSFGHVSGNRHKTREGVATREQWLGFQEVWYDARKLNQIVVEELCSYDLPVIAFPPSSAVTARNKQVLDWDTYPIEEALRNGLIPLINGDVAFDTEINGTILSTEDLFSYLLDRMRFDRILLIGTEAGVWYDFPTKKRLLQSISPDELPSLMSTIQGSNATDVTGGMAEKVRVMTALVQKYDHLKVSIFSGEEPGNFFYALLGGFPGTTIQLQA